MKETVAAMGTKRRANSARTRHLVLLGLAGLFLAGLAWYVGWHAFQHAGDVEHLFAAWRGNGFAGPLWCVALQALQVVVFFLPGEVLSFAAGYAFGTWHALAYSFLGIMVGSLFNFCLARAVGRPAMARFIKPSRLALVDRLLSRNHGRLAIFSLFLFPLGPTDALCYGAGFSGMSLLEFAAINGTARIPALLANVYLGARAASHNFVFVIIAGLLLLAALVGYPLLVHYRNRRRTAAAIDLLSALGRSAGGAHFLL
jgi:uncharacterized membrane protein YdjX (TVP38/TMEM64 family)